MLNFRLPLSWLFCVWSLSAFSLLVLKQINLVHSFQVCFDWGSWLTIWNVFPGTSETIRTLYQSGPMTSEYGSARTRPISHLSADPNNVQFEHWLERWKLILLFFSICSHSCMNCGKIVLRKVMHILNKMFIMHADVFKGWSQNVHHARRCIQGLITLFRVVVPAWDPKVREHTFSHIVANFVQVNFYSTIDKRVSIFSVDRWNPELLSIHLRFFQKDFKVLNLCDIMSIISSVFSLLRRCFHLWSAPALRRRLCSTS